MVDVEVELEDMDLVLKDLLVQMEDSPLPLQHLVVVVEHQTQVVVELEADQVQVVVPVVLVSL
jgi:hypothetical protein